MRTLATAAILLSLLFAGCTSSLGGSTSGTDTEQEDLGIPVAPPVLYLNLTVGNTTHRFASDGSASDAGVASNATASNGTTTVGSGNSTEAPANATAGNSTGNASAAFEGAAPLNVSATLEAKGLPKGAATSLTWSIDFGASAAGSPNATEPAANATGNATGANATAPSSASANGTSLPAQADFTYTEAGTYEVRASLLQGTKTLAGLNLTLVVGGNGTNATASLGFPQDLPFSAEGTIAVGTQGDGVAVFDGCGFTGTVDRAEHTWDLTAGVSSIQKFVVHMDIGTTNIDSDIYLYDPAGVEIGSSVDFNVLSQSPTEDFEVEGPLAPGTYTFRVVGCTGVEMEYSITATASVLTA